MQAGDAGNDALRELARRAGIGLGYHDVFGNFHSPSEEVTRELLYALGALAPGADPAEALEAWEDLQWQHMLPPVRVLWEGEGALTQRLVLPDLPMEPALRWRLVEENGSTRGEALTPDRYPRLGERRVGGTPHTACELALGAPPAPGYHRLEILAADTVIAAMVLIVAPARCYQPPALTDGGRVWGPAVQLYSVRSERNWGIGDFSDLRLLGEQWGSVGADVVGLNPLHALFVGNPAHASPYSPSSRRFLNVIYLDVEAVPEFEECELARELVREAAFQQRLQALREAPLVDYPACAAAKLAVLERLYAFFRDHHLARDTRRARDFRAFQRHQGPALRQFALFEALYEHLHARDPNAWGWTAWPPEYREPTSPEVEAFEREHKARVEFFEYLQWQAEQQLEAVAEHLADQGLGVGLYLDLAVSVDRGGADAWRNQGLYATGVSVGAPPDDFNRQGQDWGLPPFNPHRLREAAYGPLIGMLRENMARAGALRIDHVMGLMRLFWIPHGRGAAEGAYVHYAFEEILGIVVLESHRNRCLVIGEDLGTVPPEVQAGMQRVGMLSYKVLFFEQRAEGFKAPAEYPACALATVSTHDLPTLAGYWSGHDVALRNELGLFDNDDSRVAQVVSRNNDRSRLLLALEREGLLPEGANADPMSVPTMTEELIRNIHVYLARSPAQVMMVQPEDVLGVAEQVNLPGSLEHQHPNWRRRIPLALEQWPEHAPFLRLAAALAAQRQPSRRPKRSKKRRGVKIPCATYRLQFNAGFTFRDAEKLVPYLAALGVSHVYCSPYLRARPGSSHGYDVVDHNALNPEIGSAEDFEAFCAALEAHGMSQILDLVPNHVGVMGADNPWWLDVLENGPAALHAPYFDIDWAPAKAELKGKLLLPILGDRYGDVLERGEIVLRFHPEAGGFSAWYYDHRLPIAPDSYPELLEARLDVLLLRLGGGDPHLIELQSLVTAFRNLPPREQGAPERLLERQRDLQLHKQRLVRLCEASAEIRNHLQETARLYNGSPGEPESFDALHALLEAQPWRLAHWHAAADEINYRRFFDIHDLAALRMEDPRVFESTHQLVLKLIQDGRVEGLRIDHPDGLHDPEAYFRRLQERAALLGGDAAPGAGEPAIYLLVEKILATGEPLPESWPVHGTTGYDFLNLVNGVLVDGRAERKLRRFYAAFTGETTGFTELVYKCKRLIMKYALASELNLLAFELNRLSEADRHTRDFTLNRLRGALAEVVGWLPVYRTYQRGGEVSEADRRYLEYALTQAREDARAEELGVYDFLRSVLLREGLPTQAAAARAEEFVRRFQQYTGPVMAKGFEDTALYRYFPLVSLNDVGGDPRELGVPVEDFHRANAERARRWPHAMLATSTHDNKRSEDVRARIDVISELEGEWRARVRRWAEIAKAHKREVDAAPAPSRNDEYLLYQTLLGAWPLGCAHPGDKFIERIQAYVLKAAREAKRHTSWINPNPGYEAALSEFVSALLGDEGFLESFLPFARRVARLGLYNSLSMTLLKLTSPGVPDLYQGNELWDFSLVDPDNRRPVDYVLRAEALASLDQANPQALLGSLDDGRAKLFLTARALAARARHETLFRDGGYLPLAISGSRAEHACAFARSGPGLAITIAPRLYAGLAADEQAPLAQAVWGDTRIELPAEFGAARFIDALTGERVEAAEEAGRRVIRLRDALARFPVALLLREERGP